MSEKYMYVKLIKEWGGFQIGDVVRFGWNKGEGRVTAGEGVQVKKQKAVNDPVPGPQIKQSPKVEIAMATPKAETAEVTPEILPQKEIPAEEIQKEEQSSKNKKSKKDKKENK